MLSLYHIPRRFSSQILSYPEKRFPGAAQGRAFQTLRRESRSRGVVFCIRIFTWQNQESVVYLVVRSFPQIFCGCGEIGRHDRFRFYCSGVQVQVLSSAPEQNAQKWRSCVVSERFFFCAGGCPLFVLYAGSLSGFVEIKQKKRKIFSIKRSELGGKVLLFYTEFFTFFILSYIYGAYP